MRAVCVPDKVLAVTAEHGLFEEALDESVLLHPPNGPASAQAAGTVDFTSRRGDLLDMATVGPAYIFDRFVSF